MQCFVTKRASLLIYNCFRLLSTQEELRHISQKYTNLRVGEVTTTKAWENEKTILLKKIKELPNVSDKEDVQILIEGLVTALDTKKYTYCVVNLKKELKELKVSFINIIININHNK
jgi:uncharacterized protein YbcV (DUF1398 family)